MRLINVETYELKDFFSEETPPYAILSHTWGAEEITLQDWARLEYDESIKRKAGFLKINGACSQAKKDKLEWLWCDTNCIDKRSSAELSEAINSMFAWYRFVNEYSKVVRFRLTLLWQRFSSVLHLFS